MECASDPDGIAAGAGALPGARRRCEARSRRAAVYQDRPAPPPPDGRAFLCPDPAFPAARAPRGPFHQQQVRSLRRHARAAALAVFAVLALALPAAAQSVTTLVSNAGQSTTSAPIGGADRAQAFTTGAAGATLSSVEIISGDNEGDDMAVSLCTVDSSGYPTSSCTALTAPSSFASGTLVFTDPASTVLAATTTYTLLITSPGGESLRLTNTSSNAEETGAAAGWTIANTYHIKNSANEWEPGGFTTSFLITIKGTLSTTNTAPTGAPTITGTAQVGQTLTAVTTGILDADGLTSPTYTYQWIRVNGTEADIAGENSSTYTLVDADLGKTIKVKVSFDDDGGNTETLTSAATVTVTVAADTTPPEVVSAEVSTSTTGDNLAITFDETLDQTARSNVPVSAFSVTADGQNIAISLVSGFDAIVTLRADLSAPVITQGQAVIISYTDPTAGDDTVALQDIAGNDVASFTTGMSGVPAVTNNSTVSVNTPATGAPTITGTAQVGETLTASTTGIADANGLTTPNYTYQWIRVNGTEADITGAISSTYILVGADLGKTLKVRVSFTDDLGYTETGTSAAYPSSGTVTSTTAPALLSVTVTSTPRKTTDTYGAREHIEFSMTFDAPVTVTGDPTFAFDLGGASTATYYAGSGTTTLRFSHAVSGGSSGDRDTNGISWAQNAIALNGGTIAGTDNAVAAVLTHVAQSNLAGHKVDGRTTAVTPATVTVAVTSTPTSLADTYGFGETIMITVTASEAVEVVGDPEFEFSLTDMGGAANDVPATYDGTRSSPTTIVFTYTVQAGDRDNNGIWIGDHSRTFMLDANDRIRTAPQQIDIDRTHPEKSTHADHKVNGSLGAPTVPPDPTAPTLVSATATTLTIEWTHAGDGGSPLTRNFIEYRVEGTTDWTNWYRGETPTPVTRTSLSRNNAPRTVGAT